MIRTARDLKDALIRELTGPGGGSGWEPHRSYLGMSGIGHCQRQLYDQLVKGRKPPQPGGHWRCWLGLMYEQGVGDLLAAEIERCEEPLVASFDERYRGHVDFQTKDGALLVEVKTVTYDAFRQIRVHGVYPESHNAQVQAYLHHGPWEQAILLYMARDIPNDRQLHVPMWTFNVHPNPDIGESLDAKARRILDAFDNGTPPACLCGRHNSHVSVERRGRDTQKMER
jgi:hypothetical protein